ncbi:MAG: SDR family oxidoreductase [Acidobacteriota bacterium]|nr:SDR family oxidoreductase [Acidobacteriota bacterium]
MSQTHSTPVNVSSLFSIEGKTALITGGSRGIGLMIARGYVEAGARVYISSRKAEVCAAVAEELSAFGHCVALPADISEVSNCKALAEELSKREEKLDILVNNAGAVWGQPLAEFPEVGFDKIMDLNVKSVFFLTQQLLPLLLKAGSAEDPARVINIGSIDGIMVPMVENYSYSASKAGVHQLTRVLAVQLGGKHVTVNAVAPGPFESKMTRQLLETHRQKIEATCPLNRIGRPDDMAGIAIFLASRAGAYLNGTVIPVDGGICIR